MGDSAGEQAVHKRHHCATAVVLATGRDLAECEFAGNADTIKSAKVNAIPALFDLDTRSVG